MAIIANILRVGRGCIGIDIIGEVLGIILRFISQMTGVAIVNFEKVMPLGDLVLNSYETALETYGFDAPHLSIVKLIEDKSEKKAKALKG